MNKVIFLDRDGNLNVDHGYVYKISDWEWTPNALEGLKKLQDAGYKLAVVTNQSGIGQGLYTEDDMQALHDHMKKEAEADGVTFDYIAYCPHARDAGCACRKPGIAMIEEIAEHIPDIDYDNSWMIGDKEADMLMGKKVGTKTALITSTYWQEEELLEKPDVIAENFYEVVTKHIL